MKFAALPIGIKISLGTTIPLLLLLLLESLLIRNQLSRSEQGYQAILADLVMDQLVSRIRLDLELEDDLRIQSSLDAVGRDSEDLHRVRVFLPDGSLLAGWKRERGDSDAKVFPDSIRIVREVRKDREALGSLELVLSTARARENATQRDRGFLILLVIAISLVLGISFLVGFVLEKRFRKIHGVLKEFRKGRFSKRSEEGPDEFGLLGKTLNQMARTIQDQRRLLEAARDQALENARKAEAANQAKTFFLANMSHEIRTPMTSILGYTEVLLEGNLSEGKKREAAKVILRNGNALLEVLNEILDLTKIEGGRLVAERIPCTIGKVLEELATLLKAKADEKGLSLLFEFKSLLPKVIETDPGRLRQILLNLVDNALKFTQEGKVRVETSLTFTGEGEPRVQFEVSDTGIGMTSEEMGRIFEPFVQGDVSTTRKFGGTGLGLAISKRLAKLLGGDLILLRSEPGKGTTFRVTIDPGPLVGVDLVTAPKIVSHVKGQMEAPEGPPEKKKAEKAKSLSGLRILLAEDGLDNQKLIRHFLEKAGAEVVVVVDGLQAKETVLARQGSGEAFDLILMDMQMPVMDGYRATEELREAGFDLPIIALTAHAMAGDREKCLRAGCDEFETKPVNRKRLIGTIRTLSRSRTGREDRGRPEPWVSAQARISTRPPM